MGMKTKRLLFTVAMCAVLSSPALEIDLARVKIVRSGAETEYVKLAAVELTKHLELVSGAKADGTGVEFVCFRFYDLGRRAAGTDRDALGHAFGGLYSAKGCEAGIWRKLGGVER